MLPPDAATDSPAPLARYDVAYIDEFTFPFNLTGIASFLVVVNKGTMPLNLTSASVLSASDDNVDVTWQFELATASTTVLPPAHAGGALSVNATTKIVGSGLVSEPFDDDTLDFRIGFASFPSMGIDVHGQAKLRIDDAELVLPFTIHVVAGDRMPELNHAVRISTP